MLPDLSNDRRDTGVYHTDQSEDEQIGENNEKEVSRSDCSIEPRSSWCSLIFRYFTDNDWEEITE